MAKRPLTPSVVPATLVVAASNSLHPERADYRCTGINDHLVIQAALDALPATGGEVKLLDGTYNCEVTINLDSNQTLRGCGRNTILTTSTAGLLLLSAIGGAGTELTNIHIADLKIDGNNIGDCGIYFKYVDYSFIQNVYSGKHTSTGGLYGGGILLYESDFNNIEDCVCPQNESGIDIWTNSINNIITGNTCQGNSWYGICLYDNVSDNIILGNTCLGNTYYGIYLKTEANRNILQGNESSQNNRHGIVIDTSHNNNIIGNNCTANSQNTTNIYDDIFLAASDYNNIQGNTCRAGALVKKPRYGINISNAACDGNLVTNNDLYNDGFGTGSLNNAGTGTVTAAGNRV